jgi:hypothetical protein
MHEERTVKKITQFKLLSSRPKGQRKKKGKCSTVPSNNEDQESGDVHTKEGAMEGNC